MSTLTRRAFGASLVAGAAASRSSLRLVAAQRPATPTDLAWLSLTEAAELVKARQVSPTELVTACLERITTYNPKLNAFITVTADAALARAKALEADQRAGTVRGPLHGVPIALKDNIDTAGIRTTAASAVFDDRVPGEDAEVARRLTAAGAIVLGKLNLHEFANGGTSATSYYGPVRNPWALDRNPGGSSGGSASAVSAALCYGALGTDTGGSIRTPASYCSIVGLKPTYGLVSIRGIIPLVLSLDHCGPMTRTVADAAVMLQALAGYDRLDIASVEHPAENYVAALAAPVKGLRVGVARAPFFDHLDADVATATEAALKTIAVAHPQHERRGAADDPRRQPERRDVRLARGALHADGRTLPDPDPQEPADRQQHQDRRLHSRPLGTRGASPPHRRQLPGRRRRRPADAPPHARAPSTRRCSARRPTCRATPSSRTPASSTSTASRRSRCHADSPPPACRSG